MNPHEFRIEQNQQFQDLAFAATEQAARLDCLLPDLSLLSCSEGRYVVRILDPRQGFQFSHLLPFPKGCYTFRILDAYTAYVVSSLPQPQLLENLEHIFLPF